MSQNTHGKTIRLLTVPFTLVLYSQRNSLSCFLNNFESPPLRLSLRLSASRLRCSQFSQNISQHYTATCHYRRFTVVIYLSSFVEGSETTEPCRLYRVKNCYNVLLVLCRHTADCSARLRTHVADTLHSQLMYTVQLLTIKGGLTLILSFPKAWFLSRIRRSNFCCFLHRAF